jgi:hypothetical protein
MTITIHLSDETRKRLEQMAAAGGFADISALVQTIVEKNIEKVPDGGGTLAQEFAQLADQWRKERGATSMAKHMAEHPAYRKIVAMGDKAVPLILAELERQPDHWFIALHEITSASPVPEESRGKIKEMADAWIQWGRQHGYRW